MIATELHRWPISDCNGCDGDDFSIEFGFGYESNSQVSVKHVELEFEFCHFVDLHL